MSEDETIEVVDKLGDHEHDGSSEDSFLDHVDNDDNSCDCLDYCDNFYCFIDCVDACNLCIEEGVNHNCCMMG